MHDVSAVYAKEFCRFATLHAGLPPLLGTDEPETALSRIHGPTFTNAVVRAVALCGDPGLGLRFGTAIGGRGLGLQGIATATAATLGAALRTLARWEPLTSTLGGIRCSRDHCHIKLAWAAYRPVPSPAIEAIVSGWLGFTRSILHEERPGLLVQFVHGPWCGPSNAEEILRCPVRFNAAENAVFFPVAMHEMHSRYADSVMHARLLRLLSQMEPLLESGTDTVLAMLNGFVLARLHSEKRALSCAAARLEMSVRSLQRKLRARGISFRLLRNVLRADIALRHLIEGSFTMGDVAACVGFQEQASFYRAIRGWTGRSPRQIANRFGPGFCALRVGQPAT